MQFSGSAMLTRQRGTRALHEYRDINRSLSYRISAAHITARRIIALGSALRVIPIYDGQLALIFSYNLDSSFNFDLNYVRIDGFSKISWSLSKER